MNSCIKICYFYNMKDYIKKFTDQIDEAIKIGKNFDFDDKLEYKNIVICGLGGSVD